MNQICRSKYAQELTEQEYQLLEKQIAYYNSTSQSYASSSSLAHDPILDSIQNATIRQALYQQFKDIAEQSSTSLFDVYMKSAENQRQEYKKKYDDNVNKIFLTLDSSNDQKHLTPIMICLINERCMKIGQHIKCIYQYKQQSMLLKSNL
jgi:hypothetical protein